MQHYICKGECKGVSETPGSCGADTCSMKDQPLVECSCENASHDAEQQEEA